MTRTLTTSIQTAVAADTGTFCHLYEFQFATNTQYFTDAAVNISWNSQTWTASPMRFESVQESTELEAQGVQVTLDGVDTSIIALVLADDYIGRTAIIRLCHFDSDGTVTADPVTIFSGLMNGDFKVEERPNDTCRVMTRLVSQLAIFKQRRGIKADLHSHRAHYSTDTFFRHMTEAGNTALRWGYEWAPAPPSTTGSTGTTGGTGGGPGDDDGDKDRVS